MTKLNNDQNMIAAQFKRLAQDFHEDEDGATATEYIILLILVACVVIGIVKAFGTTVSSKFTAANSGIAEHVTFTPPSS
jgi:Flp pilus assembly pilin Flp